MQGGIKIKACLGHQIVLRRPWWQLRRLQPEFVDEGPGPSGGIKGCSRESLSSHVARGIILCGPRHIC